VKTLQIFNWQKAPSQRAVRCFFKKRVAFALMLKSGSGGATRSGVEEKIRHNSLRSAFGTYSVFFFHSATRCALGVTRALQGKVLSADACWSARLASQSIEADEHFAHHRKYRDSVALKK
jgi:hypothetical protein